MRHFFLFFLVSIWAPFCLTALPVPSLSQLSLEEKVGQVLMVHFNGREANEEAERLICQTCVGGIIYYTWANELSSPEQVQNLSLGLQNLSRNTPHALPLLIAADQEGGLVNRLRSGFTIFPGNYALGQTRKWHWGKESAFLIGQELKSVGVNLNLAPVVDVNTNPANSVIGMRTFSSDPYEVVCWGNQALEGYKQAGVIATLKHFPGYGHIEADPHEILPIVKKERDLLEKEELLPFRALAPKAEAIMTSHLSVPALDSQNCVTFSRKIVEGLLRQEMNFLGVIMTDSLAMQGILSQCSSVEEAALQSLEAGHDVVLLGGKQLLESQSGWELSVEDVIRIHRFLVNAVRQGRFSEERLDAAVSRIMALKKRYGLFERAFSAPSYLKSNIHTSHHCALAKQIAKEALRLVKGSSFLPLSFSSESLMIAAPECLKEEMEQTDWTSVGRQASIFYFKGLNPDQKNIHKIKEAAMQADRSIFFTYNAWQFPIQQELFQQIVRVSPSTVAIVVRSPRDAEHLSEADVVMCTYSTVAYSLQAAFDFLQASFP